MPLKTAFLPQHQGLEASLGAFDGVLLPSHYKSARREYRSSVTAAGMLDWGFHSLLSASGPDAADFLNRLLSNTVPPPGSGCHTFLLNVGGKPVLEAWLYATGEGYYLEVPAPLSRVASEQLNHYHFTEKLTLSERSDLAGLALIGPNSRKVLEGVTTGELPDSTMGVSRVRVTRLLGGGQAEALCTRNSYASVETWVLWVNASEAERVWERLMHTRVKPVPVGTDALEVLRVEAGSPRFGLDYDENTLFLEVAPADSYHEGKGCYIGQEVVARILHQGHVNRRLVGISFNGKKPLQGRLLADGKEVGRITSSLVSPDFGPIALAYVRREHWHAGTVLSTEKGQAARTHELPFRPKKG